MSSHADPIYLDHNATTPLHPEVLDAMIESHRGQWGNPSSSHVYGQRAADAIAAARAEVAGLIGASPAEIIFTSGGTEASNLAIRGAAALRRGALVTSAVEHPATLRPLSALTGRRVVVLPVDGEGRVDADAALPEEVALLTVMHANNEVGTIQPIAALAARCGGLVHTDAAQSLGKVPVDVTALSVDLLTIAGHKLYAPKGIGALYVRDGLALPPLLLGAGHERGLRPGTENVAGIVGLGVACRLAGERLAAEATRLSDLRERLWERLSAGVDGLRPVPRQAGQRGAGRGTRGRRQHRLGLSRDGRVSLRRAAGHGTAAVGGAGRGSPVPGTWHHDRRRGCRRRCPDRRRQEAVRSSECEPIPTCILRGSPLVAGVRISQEQPWSSSVFRKTPSTPTSPSPRSPRSPRSWSPPSC
jgi:cysteine desulfurase